MTAADAGDLLDLPPTPREERLQTIEEAVRDGEVLTAEEVAAMVDVTRSAASRYAHDLADRNEDLVYSLPSRFENATTPKTLRMAR